MDTEWMKYVEWGRAGHVFRVKQDKATRSYV